MKDKKPTICITADSLCELKEKLIDFCNNKSILHITIEGKKIHIDREKMRIDAVYNHFIILKPIKNEFGDTYTINFVDVANKKVFIEELI